MHCDVSTRKTHVLSRLGMKGVNHKAIADAIQSPSSIAFSEASALSSRSLSRLWKATTSASFCGPIASRAMSTATRIASKCSTACPNMETRIAGWKSERSGRCGDIFWMGVAYEKARLAIINSHDDAIICRSEERAPSRESAERTYAEISDSSIMICCCCSAESSVQRPCRIRSTMFLTEGERDVKGAATDASPGRTIGSAPSADLPISASIFAFNSAIASF
mmetsp:Transcript_41839/g.98005  ORF Transcript_41839/g.98005 Transcript_41839/m.98005 type:complete len:222 (-) Transcript_41839:621-1286(-)